MQEKTPLKAVFFLIVRKKPLLAAACLMAGFRTEIRAIGSAAADRACARIQSRLLRKRKKTQGVYLRFFYKKGILCARQRRTRRIPYGRIRACGSVRPSRLKGFAF